MAKKLQVSSDSGVTYYDLPGNSASFDSDTSELEDTIFGQTYKSTDVGIISWSMSADSFYKGYAGYKASIKKVGSGTATVGEACTQIGTTQTWQINATTKRIWDRASTVTVKDNAIDHTADVASIDFLFGKVTFNSTYTVTGPVTVDVTYFPTAALAKANSYTLTMTADQIDTSDFDTATNNGGYATFDPGLRTVSLELSGIMSVSTTNFRTELASRNEFLIEINPDGVTKSIARGYFKLASGGQSGDVGALEEESLTFNLIVPTQATGPALATPFGWEHTATTMSTAMQKVLDAWLNETKLKARYLPSGAINQTPKDGIEGTVMVAETSLSGDMSNVNTFSVSLQGDGAYTVV